MTSRVCRLRRSPNSELRRTTHSSAQGAGAATRTQREEDARILKALLPLELQKTDRYLLTERARADDAVANRDDRGGPVIETTG